MCENNKTILKYDRKRKFFHKSRIYLKKWRYYGGEMEEMFMKMDEILDTIAELAKSQGFYGRLLRDILELKKADKNGYKKLTEELENQNFQTTLDMVLFFEC